MVALSRLKRRSEVDHGHQRQDNIWGTTESAVREQRRLDLRLCPPPTFLATPRLFNLCFPLPALSIEGTGHPDTPEGTTMQRTTSEGTEDT